MTRAASPDEHPWRARVLSLAQATGVDLSARVDNDVVRNALWARDRAAAHALLCPTRRTSVRTRATGAAGGFSTPRLDVFTEISTPSGSTASMQSLQCTKRALMRGTSDTTLPFVRLCSAHLPDDPLTLSGPHCHLCAATLCPARREALLALERDWHHVWHELIECPRRRRRRDALENLYYVAASQASASPAPTRLSHMSQQVVNHSAAYAQGAVASNEMRQDFLTFLVNPAQHMPKCTHVAVLSDVLNLVTADRALHNAGAPAAVDVSSASDTDLDDACYEEAVAALGLEQPSARTRKPGHASRRRPPRGATLTPARGGQATNTPLSATMPLPASTGRGSCPYRGLAL